MASEGGVEGDRYRYYLHGEGERSTKWKFGTPPNYEVVNKLFEEGRTKIWPAGSLEEKVQNLVKTWEMELFHKANIEDFKTLDPNKYTFSLNGRKGINLEEIGKLGGGYNPLLQTTLPENLRGYNPDVETSESSHKAFTTTFPRGFALEILQVISGPPQIVYKFRHWGYMEGPFKGHAPTGELVEVYGMAIFELDENEKIVKVEFFYDPGQLLGGLLKGAKVGSSSEETATGCPILRSTG
ncbi:putative NTF2-like domain-containing protein [Rosa chinensis]|uniref:Putative NTF2-like domain-containing protein n=1 Tax=Rosa chinensis TaxID=74649 RepID=A0A2P6PSF9_ROSCH|nr:pathogen-related protein [Rosa chinensis]PRQ24846.1 putative NTF2-like domain-containing protein [Rosa chinensis]